MSSDIVSSLLCGLIGAILGAIVAFIGSPVISRKWNLAKEYNVSFMNWCAKTYGTLSEIYTWLTNPQRFSPLQINIGFNELHSLMDAIHNEGWIEKLRLEGEEETAKVADALHYMIDEFCHESVIEVEGRQTTLRQLELELDQAQKEEIFRKLELAKHILLHIYLCNSILKRKKGRYRENEGFERLIDNLGLKEQAERLIESWEQIQEEGPWSPALEELLRYRLIVKYDDRYRKKGVQDLCDYLYSIEKLMDATRKMIKDTRMPRSLVELPSKTLNRLKTIFN
ncbi:hypothetical protein B6U99_05595 [Candidatus Geothermarchaeota archaeon ex4572_27]|nr:MAG: hypothetical protein B6U99_05595 [Candidatus Geothermarchaeota archaeon ex4572_27]